MGAGLWGTDDECWPGRDSAGNWRVWSLGSDSRTHAILMDLPAPWYIRCEKITVGGLCRSKVCPEGRDALGFYQG